MTEPSNKAVDPKLVEICADLDAAVAALPKAEQEEYERCQQSIVDARRAAESEGHRIWIV